MLRSPPKVSRALTMVTLPTTRVESQTVRVTNSVKAQIHLRVNPTVIQMTTSLRANRKRASMPKEPRRKLRERPRERLRERLRESGRKPKRLPRSR